MQPDSELPRSPANPQSGTAPPPLVATAPLPPVKPPVAGSASVRPMLAILLSLGLGLFLLDAAVSLMDESLSLFFAVHFLKAPRALLALFALFVSVVIYGLMGLTPMIPKRLFLPLALFNLAGTLVVVPLAIYFYNRIHLIAWGIALVQVVVGLGILHFCQGGFRLRWPLVAEQQLVGCGFSWRNLAVFLVVNVFGLLPAITVYLGLCAALAVDHFSEGFLALRPVGLTVQVRKYVRDDGKSIQLVPMSHIGEPEFYQSLAGSFPTNAIILMEGVSDDQNLITNRITYQRMATALGVAEQHEEFQPRGEMVSADVDVAEFTSNTIAGLNLVMLLHTRGMNPETILKLMQFSPPHFEEQLFEDLLRKRNRHLLEEIQTRLLQWENIIVPWGAAHMPEIAREIQKAGFRLGEQQEYVAIRFRSEGNTSKRNPTRGD